MRAEPNDRQLVTSLLRSRDERVFRLLYRRHTPTLYPMAMRLTGDADDAADAVQDTWLRALEGLEAFAWRSTLRTWLSGILVNCIRELWRETDRKWTSDALDGLPDERPSDQPLPGGVERLDLDAALSHLAAGYRAALVLHDVEGFTHTEIAEFLGIDVGTSKSQLSRARVRLAHLLHADDGRE